MNRMSHFARVLIAIVAVAAVGAGCKTYQVQTQTAQQLWNAGNTPQAAAEFGKSCGAADSVLWHLEAAAAYRASRDFANSNQRLDAAAEQIDKFDQEAKIKAVGEGVALLTNPKTLPYTGRSYDRIMLHTYRALNHLAVGEVDQARPEIIHAYQCQQDAVEENKARIEKAQIQEQEQKEKDRRKIERARTDPKCAQGLESVTKDIEGFKFYADYVNPFTVYLDGLYFLHTGADASDLERARKSLNRVIEVTGSNKFVQADLDIAENGGPTQPAPCTYVIFETGSAASRSQIRIDIPIFISDVPYLGVAFPKLVLHNNQATELTVKAGELEEKTATIASMDPIIGLDFKNELPVILTRALISTTVKAGAAAVAIEAARKSGPLATTLIKGIAMALQASANVADDRSWTTLPKEFQIARIATPSDRKIVLSTASSGPVEVALVDGVVNVVCVRNINASSPLLVNQFKLK